MSKQDSFEAFLADVVGRVPEDRRAAVEEALKLDEVRTELDRGYKRQSDYSRNMDQLRREREEFEAMVAEANDRIGGWQDWYETAQQEIEAMAGHEQGGKEVVGLTPEDVDKIIRQRDEMAITFADKLTDIKIDYKERFKEKLNTAEVVALAAKSNVPLEVAYEMYINPKVVERQKLDFEEAIKRAREEGAREYATRHNLPVMSGPQEAHTLDLAPTAKTTARDRIAAAVADFNSRSVTP